MLTKLQDYANWFKNLSEIQREEIWVYTGQLLQVILRSIAECVNKMLFGVRRWFAMVYLKLFKSPNQLLISCTYDLIRWKKKCFTSETNSWSQPPLLFLFHKSTFESVVNIVLGFFAISFIITSFLKWVQMAIRLGQKLKFKCSLISLTQYVNLSPCWLFEPFISDFLLNVNVCLIPAVITCLSRYITSL